MADPKRASDVLGRLVSLLDALLSETSDDGTPVAYIRVAGVVGNGSIDGVLARTGKGWTFTGG